MKFCIKKYAYITEENTDVSFLEPMIRRKLSALDKIAMCALNNCYENKDVKMIFSSHYGELDRLRKLVQQYTTENEVSPTTFSFSVHNSAIGQFSLINKINESYNSISAENDSFISGLAEAIISAKEKDVLFCFCDTEKKKEAFACLISTNNETKDYELFIKEHNNEKHNEFDDCRNFLNFIEKRNEVFKSQNGLFEIKRIEDIN